jgi:putative ABC transport system permease protein
MQLPDADTLTGLLAAWLLLAAASAWAWQQRLDVSRKMLFASLRGLVQLLVIASVLHLIFGLQQLAAQVGIILLLCLIASRISAGHYPETNHAWLAAFTGLAAGCLATLPWLVFSGAISGETRTLIPLASMVVANAMNIVSLMLDRIAADHDFNSSVRAAMIPPVDTLRVVGLVHLPGIFVGMILAGASPIAAASAQLVVLYMVVASALVACVVAHSTLNRLKRASA